MTEKDILVLLMCTICQNNSNDIVVEYSCVLRRHIDADASGLNRPLYDVKSQYVVFTTVILSHGSVRIKPNVSICRWGRSGHGLEINTAIKISTHIRI